MASTYDIVTQYETVEFLGGTQTRPVVAVGVRTKAHGIYFEFRVPKKSYTSNIVKIDATGFTIVYELIFTIPGVTDVEWTQEPTNAGQLQDHVLVYFESTSGNSSASIDVPYSQFTQDYIASRVGFARDGLDAAEQGEVLSQGSPPVYGIDYGLPAGERASSNPEQGVFTIH
jgi:hypothetical protein